MKIVNHQTAVNTLGAFLFKIRISRIIAAVIILLFCGFISTPAKAQRVDVRLNINLPQWAPRYENVEQVQYYYLPDIECYYDVLNREFVYLEDGNWIFRNTLPPAYSWFDLNNAFIVVLNSNVHQPWMHFHYYVAHYPRYYYRSLYRDHENYRSLRGFNENARSPFFNQRAENSRNEIRPGDERQRNAPERKVEQGHQAQPMNYYGRPIGQPVKVQRNMMKPKEERNQDKNSKKNSNKNSDKNSDRKNDRSRER